jgi:hypothetical protein
MKIRPVGTVLFRADRQKKTDVRGRNTDMTKLMIAFRKSGEERQMNKLSVHRYSSG